MRSRYFSCPIRYADGRMSKMVGRIPMRTEPAKNRPYISGKIWPFWIGHCSALSSVLLGSALRAIQTMLLDRTRARHGAILTLTA